MPEKTGTSAPVSQLGEASAAARPQAAARCQIPRLRRISSMSFMSSSTGADLRDAFVGAFAARSAGTGVRTSVDSARVA
jgi:hypothetical protein